MATTLYPINFYTALTPPGVSTPAGTGGVAAALSTARGAAAESGTTPTANGPTTGVAATGPDPNSGFTGHRRIYISSVLAADVAVSGTITFNIRMAESNMSANVGADVLVERCDSLGNVISTVVRSEKGAEVGTTEAAQNWTATPGSTINFKKGDRIKVTIFGNDGGGNMASGFTFTVWTNGPTAAASGDTWIQFTETITFDETIGGSGSRHYGHFEGPASDVIEAGYVNLPITRGVVTAGLGYDRFGGAYTNTQAGPVGALDHTNAHWGPGGMYCDAQCSSLTVAGHWSALVGPVSLSTDVAKVGTQSIKIAASAAQASLQKTGWGSFVSAGNSIGVNYYVRFSSLPVADASLTTLKTDAGAHNVYFGYDHASGKFCVWKEGDFANRILGPTVSADTWYKVGLRGDYVNGNFANGPHLNWLVDEVAQTALTTSPSDATAVWNSFALGQLDTAESGVAFTTYTAYFDSVEAQKFPQTVSGNEYIENLGLPIRFFTRPMAAATFTAGDIFVVHVQNSWNPTVSGGADYGNILEQFLMERTNGAGTVIETIASGKMYRFPWNSDQSNWFQVPSTVSLSNGDRIKVTIQMIDETDSGPMSGGGSVFLSWNVVFDQALTELINAPAGNAAGAGTAYNPSITIFEGTFAPAGSAAGAGTSQTPAASVSVHAEAASGTGQAIQPAVSVPSSTNVFPDASTGSGAAFNPSISISKNALPGVAAGAGAAHSPLPFTAKSVPAGRAIATGIAYRPTIQLPTSQPGTAPGVGAAYDANINAIRPPQTAYAAYYKGAGKPVHVLDALITAPTVTPQPKTSGDVPYYKGALTPLLATGKSPKDFNVAQVAGPTFPYAVYEGMSKAIHVFGPDDNSNPGPPILGCSVDICGITDSFDRPDIPVDYDSFPNAAVSSWGTSDAGIEWIVNAGLDETTVGYVESGRGVLTTGAIPHDSFGTNLYYGSPIPVLVLPEEIVTRDIYFEFQMSPSLHTHVDDADEDQFLRCSFASASTDFLFFDIWPSFLSVSAARGDGPEVHLPFEPADTLCAVRIHAENPADEFLSSQISAKIWHVGDPEPDEWTVWHDRDRFDQAIRFTFDYLQFVLKYVHSDVAPPNKVYIGNINVLGVNKCTLYKFDTFTRDVSGAWGNDDWGDAWDTSYHAGFAAGDAYVRSAFQGGRGYLYVPGFFGVGSSHSEWAFSTPFTQDSTSWSVTTRFRFSRDTDSGPGQLGIFGDGPWGGPSSAWGITIHINNTGSYDKLSFFGGTGSTPVGQHVFGPFDHQEQLVWHKDRDYILEVIHQHGVGMTLTLWQEGLGRESGWSSYWTIADERNLVGSRLGLSIFDLNGQDWEWGFDYIDVDYEGRACYPGSTETNLSTGTAPVIFRPQIGDPTTTLDRTVCLLESAAMVLDWHTQGGLQLWGGQLVPWCGRSEDQIRAVGTSLDNAKQAWAHFGQYFDIRAGEDWSHLIGYLNQGRAVVLAGLYIGLGAIRCDDFEGSHAVAVMPYQNGAGTSLLVGDPLCRNFKYEDMTALRTFAELLGEQFYGVRSPQPIYFGVSRAWSTP